MGARRSSDHIDARTRQVLQLVRVVELDRILRAGEQCTAAELAERLAVSTRTVRRYVRVLERAGMPVANPNVGGYYYSRRARPLTLEVVIGGAVVTVRPRTTPDP